MKRQIVILTSALALVLYTASAATAQVILSFSSAAQVGAPGSTVTFSGSISNIGSSTVFLNSDAFTLTGTGLTLDDSLYFANAPLSLDPGISTGTIGLFTVAIDPATGVGSYPGSFSVLGGADSNAQDTLATAPFTVGVASPSSATPEPGALALLMGAASTGSLFALRHLRRRP
jgi:hypothetical protein